MFVLPTCHTPIRCSWSGATFLLAFGVVVGCSLVVDRIAPGATFFGGWICALVRLTISRAAAEANRIWGGVHV